MSSCRATRTPGSSNQKSLREPRLFKRLNGATTSVSSKQLLDTLENSVLHYPHASGRFLQVSGLSYTFDPDAPAGERVVEVYIHPTPKSPAGGPLQLDHTYRVAVTDFIAVGGDDYAMLGGAPVFFGSTTEGGAYL